MSWMTNKSGFDSLQGQDSAEIASGANPAFNTKCSKEMFPTG
jgi:hypothetical protein